MGTTADKLNYLLATKEEIRTAIIGRGVAVPDGTTFRQYAALIGSIVSAGESGGVTLPETPSGAPGTTIIPNTPENIVKPSDPETPVTPYDPDKPEEMEVPKNIIEKETGQSADTFDVMILQNGTGDVTYGFLEKGLWDYNGTVLKPIPENALSFPYLVLYKREQSTQLLVAFQDKPSAKQVTSMGQTITYYGTYETGQHSRYGLSTTGSFAVAENVSGYQNHDIREVLWANHDVFDVDGSLYLAGSSPIEHKDFEITWYDPSTTNFKAKGWRRLSYHRQGDYWQSDDFTTVESGGWNYLKHITECTREKLYYMGEIVWSKS